MTLAEAVGHTDPMSTYSRDTLLTGLAFPEGPRWHDGALWFSDIYAGQVHRFDPVAGTDEIVAELAGGPSGLGFLPDGRLLIANGADRTVYVRGHDGALTAHADLSAVATWTVNDMVVDDQGRAYVGNYGDDSAPPAPPRPSALAMVDVDGTVTTAATEMMFPNGMVITGDRRTLIVAETRATPGRLTAFSIADDGTLSDRRTLIEFGPTVFPDGIAIDDEDGVWVASPFDGAVIRVDQAGAITERIEVPGAFAVAIDTAAPALYVTASADWVPEKALADRTGRIDRIALG